MSCKQCANGTTSSAGASICNDGCDAGTYLVGFACIDCPAGQYSLAGASGGCTPCSAGYFAATTVSKKWKIILLFISAPFKNVFA
jgi:syndecan 4